MKYILSLILLFLTSGVYANIIQQDVNINSKIFSVELDANPTTGYQWFLKEYDKNLISLANTTYIPENPQRIGSGGKTIFTFKIVAKKIPDTTKIILIYKRPWEKQSSPPQIVEINFK